MQRTLKQFRESSYLIDFRFWSKEEVGTYAVFLIEADELAWQSLD